MMQFDFDQVIDRRGTSCVKWEVADNELPMWVADMDFSAAPVIREALQKILDHGVFGYSVLPDAWYTSIMDWWRTRHGFEIEKEWLLFSTGVIPAIASGIRRLTVPGEKVLIQTPVYNVFFDIIRDNGRILSENRLLYDRESASYRVDWEDLEEKLSDPSTRLMILCNPQNPIGKIWEKETLQRIGELAAANHVTVLSDEIHCDLAEPGEAYVPFASASATCRDISVTCVAPTKAFNLAGVHSAAVVIPNPDLRGKIERALQLDCVAQADAFAAAASIAAFSEGGPWLNALNAYLSDNRKRVAEFVETEISGIRLVSANATYLLWLDCNDLIREGDNIGAFLRRETGLFLCDGAIYGENGSGFLRMNIACPRVTLEDGLTRLNVGIKAYEAAHKRS